MSATLVQPKVLFVWSENNEENDQHCQYFLLWYATTDQIYKKR